MTEPTILTLLNPHVGRAWDPEDPASEADISAAERAFAHPLPLDYAELLRASAGGGLYGPEAKVVLIPPAHLMEFNPDPASASDFTGMVIFADDQGDYFYFFDPMNALGRGAWAIFATFMGEPTCEDAIYVARDLSDLFQRVLSGEALI